MSRRVYTWADIGTQYDGPHATPTRTKVGPYFLNISSLNNGRLDLNQSDHVSEADFDKWTRRVTPQANDLLFSYETRLGEAALMPDGVEACLGRRMALLRPNTQLVVPRYLLYYYLSPAVRRLIDQNAIHGATVDRISLSTMGSWELELPTLSEQQAIAEVLGALDDKIAANTKLADTADELSRTFFRRVSARGDLIRLSQFVSLSYGKALQSSARRPGAVQVVGSGGIVGSHDTPLVQQSGIVLGRKGSMGSVHWIEGAHWPIDTTYFVRMTQQQHPLEYAYYLLQSLPLEKMNNDSAVPGLNRDEAYALPVRLPDDALLDQFARVTRPLFARRSAALAESQVLSKMRDTLLPQLMSGKLRVEDDEKVAEAVV